MDRDEYGGVGYVITRDIISSGLAAHMYEYPLNWRRKACSTLRIRISRRLL